MKKVFLIALIIALMAMIAGLCMGNFVLARIAVFIAIVLLIPNATMMKWSL